MRMTFVNTSALSLGLSCWHYYILRSRVKVEGAGQEHEQSHPHWFIKNLMLTKWGDLRQYVTTAEEILRGNSHDHTYYWPLFIPRAVIYTYLFGKMCSIMDRPWAFLKTVKCVSGPSRDNRRERQRMYSPAYCPCVTSGKHSTLWETMLFLIFWILVKIY